MASPPSLEQYCGNSITPLVRHMLPMNFDERQQPGNVIKPKKPSKRAISAQAKRKEFNLSTPKLHLLGHYVPVIRWFGATPGYSTQRVCLLSLASASLLINFLRGNWLIVKSKDVTRG